MDSCNMLGDLLTVVAQKLPIKFVLFNKSSLSMVRAEMMVGGYPFFGTEVENPDLAAVAVSPPPWASTPSGWRRRTP